MTMSNEMRRHEELSEAQRRHLSATCTHIDKLLCEIEQVLNEPSAEHPFPHYIQDLSAEQSQAIQAHVRRLRQQLLHSLAWQQIEPETPMIPASRAILARVTFMDIAIEELKPRHMRGSGQITSALALELNEIVQGLHAVVHNMEAYLISELRPEAGPE